MLCYSVRVCSLPAVHLGFLWVCWFPPSLQQHPSRCTVYTQIECVCVHPVHFSHTAGETNDTMTTIKEMTENELMTFICHKMYSVTHSSWLGCWSQSTESGEMHRRAVLQCEPSFQLISSTERQPLNPAIHYK